MVEIIWTDEAESCLNSIYEHIAADSPTAAGKVLRGIHQKAMLLKQHPQLGWRYEAIPDREVRIILFGHYRIAYLVRSEIRIEILGVYHAAMDIEQHLKQS